MKKNNFKQSELYYRGMIYSTYNNYQKFVDKELPDIKIVFVDPEITMTYKIICFLEYTPIVLKINKRYLTDPNFGSILYHEFTHIYDYVLFETITSRLMKLRLYSEYHATQIEIIKKFDLIDKLKDEIDGRSIILNNFEMAHQLNDENTRILKLYVDKISSNFENTIKFDIDVAYFYYLGVNDLICSILQLKSTDGVSYIDSKKNDDYKKIHALLKNIKYNQKPNDDLIEEISKLY